MSVRSIYVLERGERDLSRWLDILPCAQDECLVRMNDLVHPGMQSSFRSFRCATAVLRDIASGGFAQVRSTDGYCVLRGIDQFVEISFQGDGDGARTTCMIAADELLQSLETLHVEMGPASLR